MKQKYLYCLNSECHAKRDGRPAVYQLVGSAKNPNGEALEHVYACTHCGATRQEPIPKRRCHKRTWPYHNESAGVTFESESHEQKYCKEHNLTPINK